jgi:pyrroline-5-carboxylate reductase
MKSTVASRKFDAWVKEVGVEHVARVLGCHPTFVSHLRRATKKAGLKTALAVEAATSARPGGQITCGDWRIASSSDESNDQAADAHAVAPSTPEAA